MVSGSVYFLLVGLTFGFLINDSAADECKKSLGYLASCQDQFVYCSVDHSWPKAESCIDCYPKYKDMMTAYSTFVSLKNCSEKVLNRNRLNMVYLMQNTLVDIWNKGFCDDCFEGDNVSNSSLTFKKLKFDFDNCLETTKPTDVCSVCIKYYVPLNGFYMDMEKITSGKICFDIQDAMNVTRSKWSKDLNCCRREYSLTLFLIFSSIFGALPIIFYFGMYAHTKRVERNHQILDETSGVDVPTTSSAAISSHSSSNPNTNSNPTRNLTLPSTSTATDTSLADEIRIMKKNKALDDDLINGKPIDEQSTSSQPSGNNLINL